MRICIYRFADVLRRFCILVYKTFVMIREKIGQNLILKLPFDFALLIITNCERLGSEKKYVIARQLLKSGTSVGANTMEEKHPSFIYSKLQQKRDNVIGKIISSTKRSIPCYILSFFLF